IQHVKLKPECPRGLLCLCGLRIDAWPCWIHENGHRCGGRHQFTQQPHALSTKVGAELGEARYVSARPVEACNQADLDGIGSICKQKWNCCGPRFRRQCRGWAAAGCNERYLTASQIGSKCRQSIKLMICPSIFDRNISTFGITGLAHTLPEGGQTANIIDIP